MPSFVIIHYGRKKKTFIDSTFSLCSHCRGKWSSSDLFFLLMCDKDIVSFDSSQCEQEKLHGFQSVLIRFGPLPYGVINAI